MSRALLALLALTALPGAAQAWGEEGHEIIGLIAQHYLTPTVRDKVRALLAADRSGLTQDTGIGAEAAWADEFRDSDRSAGKTHYEQTRQWHYVDIEIAAPSLDAACFGHPARSGVVASLGVPQDCIVDKIDEFRAELADPRTPAAERLLALQFLLHFVGDLHQPLHSADDHDRGGNDKHVMAAGARAGSLHHYWDTVFVLRLGPNSTQVAQQLIARISSAERRAWSAGTPSQWALQSFALAKARAYGGLPAPDDRGQYQLGREYVADAIRTVRLQLERAGVRLALELNGALQ